MWWRAWAKERALAGLSSEMGLGVDQVIDWPCLLNLYDCASDAVVKQRIKMLLDLSAIEEEQVSLYGIRAGRRGKQDSVGCGLDPWKDVLQGEILRGSANPGPFSAASSGPQTTSFRPRPFSFASSIGPWRIMPSRIAILPAAAFWPTSRRTTFSAARYPGEGRRTEDGGRTKNPLSPFRPASSVLRSMEAPGNWHRLIFDDMNAVFFPFLTGDRQHVQYQNVYISCWAGSESAKQTIEFTPELKVVERSGWLFLTNGPAFAGIQIQGGYNLGTTDRKIPGRPSLSAITFKDAQALVVLQAGDVAKFGSFEKFQEAVVKAPLQFADASVKYSGPQAPAIEFFRDPAKTPSIEGKKDNPGMVYDSPYLQGRTGNHQVTVRFGSYAATYDFETNQVHELGGR